MPTLKEIYEGQSNWVFGTNYTSVKPDKDTVIEQEVTGIRIKSAVELNNPLIYGNEAIRIANKTTKSVEDMKNATGGTGGDGGLIGKGLGAITGGGFGRAIFGGQVNSLNQARDGVNSRLGIPIAMIPTYVDGHGGLQAGIEPDTMITLGKIRNDANGTEFGKFLKQTGGGNFRTIGRNILGQGISLVKDALRDKLFGSPAGLGENAPTNGLYEYSSVNPYSTTIRNNKLNEPENDKLQLLESQAKEKIDELKNKTKNLLKKNKKIDEEVEDKTTSDEESYSLRNEQLRVKDSKETNLSVPSKESDDEKKQDNLNQETLKLPLGETAEDKSTSDESTYSETVRDQQVDDREAGTFSRIDLSKIPGNNPERKSKFFRTKGGTADLKGTPNNNAYDDEVGYTSTVGKASHEQKGLTSNSGDLINSVGLPVNDEYKDGDVTYSKTELEALDLIPLWISGLDSSKPVFFRTIITGLTETVSPSWSSGQFVGNPYKYYTYDGVERSVTFNLNLYCMNQYEMMKNWERITYLTSKAYPSIKDNLVYPPFIKFRLGDIYNNKTGFIESLSYTMPDTGVWETEVDGSLLPKFIDVAMTIKFVEIPGSELALYSYKKSQEAIEGIKQTIDPAPESGEVGDENFNDPNSNTRTAGTDAPVVIDPKTGNLLDSNDSVKPEEDKSKNPPVNLNTGKKEPTPKAQNGVIADGPQIVTFSSEADSSFEEKYNKIKKVLPDRKGALKLAKRYGNPKLYLIEIKKEKENIYYIKEELSKESGNIEREYAYKQENHYGAYPKGYISIWYFERWDKYLKSQNKKIESDAMLSSDLPGGIF